MRGVRRVAGRTAGAPAGSPRAVPVGRLSRSLTGLSLTGLAVAGSVCLAEPAAAAGPSVTTTADSGPGSLRQACSRPTPHPG